MQARLSFFAVLLLTLAPLRADVAQGVTAAAGAETIRIQCFVKADLKETLKVDAPVNVTVDGAKFEGKISFIRSKADAPTGLLHVEVLVVNKEQRIKPGVSAIADFGK